MGCFRFLATLLITLTLLPCAANAQQETKSFAVLPFTINGPDKYQYLGRGIQDMLISRLTWSKHFEHIGKDKLGAATTPTDNAQASKSLGGLDSDYLVWGSVTIMGDECSVDVRTTDRAGETVPNSAQTSIGQLIPTLESTAKKINSQVFKREIAEAQTPNTANAPKRTNRMNPALVHNETSATEEFYINPQFRYAGGAGSEGRWRSPSMPFINTGMVVGDADGDGNNEIFFISQFKVHAYRVVGDKFMPLGEIAPGGRVEMLKINLADLNRDGYMEIVLSGYFDDEPYSYILNFRDGKFVTIAERIKFHLNVAKLPPTYQPILIGQGVGKTNVLNEVPVHEVVKIGGRYTLGKRIPLPKKANVFNFAFVPGKGVDYRILVVDSSDHILVYTPKFDMLAATMEQYAGSALGFEVPDTMPGLGTATDQFVNMYYVPLRLVVHDLDRNGQYDVLLNKNISLAAQFFQRYRFFPNGEIHSMFWDGVGLSLAWKTRRIKGTVTDYGLADINNDGIKDLYVSVNTYPGPSGINKRRSMIVAYPLDLEKTDAPANIVNE